MKRFLWTAALVIVLLALGAGYWWYRSYRQPAPAATKILPASSLLFVNVPDFPRACERLTNTAAYALFNEPGLKAALEQPLRALRKAAGGRADDTNIDAAAGLALAAIRGEAFVAVTRFTPFPKPQVGLVVGADLRQRALETRAALVYHEHQLGRHNPSMQVSKGQHLGVNYRGWHLNGQQVYHAFLNSMLVAALDEDTLRDVITRFRGRAAKDSPSLAESKAFRNLHRQLPGNPELVSFVNVEQITQLILPVLLLSGRGGNSLEKLARIEAIGMGTTVRHGQLQDTGVTTYNSASRAAATPIKRRTFALTTPATMLYTVQPVRWGETYAELLDTLAATGNDQLISRAQNFERTLRRQQIHPRDEFFEFLGPETAMFATWRPGAQYPEITLAVQLRESARARLHAVMGALKETVLGTEPSWEAMTAGDQTFRVLRLGAGLVAPTYFVADDFLIITSSPDNARELAAQWRAPTSTLAAEPRYQAATAGLPAAPDELVYLDIPALVRSVYPRVRNGGWPQAETLARHLAPYVSATTTGPQLETTTTISTLGKPLTLAAGLASVLAAIQPQLTALQPMAPPAGDPPAR